MRRRIATVVALATLVAVPLSAHANGPSRTQPLVDGCQRNNTQQLTLSTAEWSYVNRAQVLADRATNPNAGVRTVEGLVVDTHPAGDDLYWNHDFYDFGIGVLPDPAYAELLGAGNEKVGTSLRLLGTMRQATGEVPATEVEGILGTEVEASKVPLGSLPHPGDRVRLSGSWIWDCGHWGNPGPDPSGLSQFIPYDPVSTSQDLFFPGALGGESTELHPLHEIATFRTDAAGILDGQTIGRELSRLDVWLTGDGGPALAEEECALLGIPPLAMRAACSEVRDIGGDYSYTMTLPERPTPSSSIVVNPVIVRPVTDAALASTPVTLTPDPDAGTVTVSFTIPSGGAPQHYGITVEAGWKDAPPAVHHTVTLNAMFVVRSLDGDSEPHINPANRGEQTSGPGEWLMYGHLNGQWFPLGYHEVEDGQMVPIDVTHRIWLPQGVEPRLYVTARECDIPLMDCSREAYGATEDFTNPFRELGFNDRPGRLHDGRRGLVLQPGTHTYRPRAHPSVTSGNEDNSDAICGLTGCYSMIVTLS